MEISSLAQKVSGSETMAIAQRSAELRQMGIDVVSFAAGEPDFDTPDYIKKAAIEALHSGYTKYTAASGAQELKAAIAKKIGKESHAEYAPAQIVVTAGAKQALYLTFQAILEPKDEVIIPKPYWVSFPQQVLMCGGKPVFIETVPEENFAISLQRLEEAKSSRTKALILNSPSNPTGAVYSRTNLEEIMDWAKKNNIWVVSDETYEALVYDGAEHISPASLSKDALSRTIITSSFSKSYAMTGWRVGYLAAPSALAAATGRIASHTTSNVNSIAQKAALAAIEGPQDDLARMKEAFNLRRLRMCALLQAIPKVECLLPKGAFYAFPKMDAFLGKTYEKGKITTAADLAAYLLDEAAVALVPGGAFGAEGYLRLSYATSLNSIEQGIARMTDALGKIL